MGEEARESPSLPLFILINSKTKKSLRFRSYYFAIRNDPKIKGREDKFKLRRKKIKYYNKKPTEKANLSYLSRDSTLPFQLLIPYTSSSLKNSQETPFVLNVTFTYLPVRGSSFPAYKYAFE